MTSSECASLWIKIGLFAKDGEDTMLKLEGTFFCFVTPRLLFVFYSGYFYFLSSYVCLYVIRLLKVVIRWLVFLSKQLFCPTSHVCFRV